MKEEKKESPIGVLWGWGKPYHGKFIGSIILAVLGVACQMVPYFCVAHIVTLMLSGEQDFSSTFSHSPHILVSTQHLCLSSKPIYLAQEQSKYDPIDSQCQVSG